MQYVQACIWSKAMIIIDDVFNDPVINKRIVNAVKYYKVLKTYHLLTDEQRRELFDAEEKRKNRRIYRGVHDLNALEADYIEAHGGNVENEELLKFFFNMGGRYGVNYADNIIISFDKKDDITNFINADIKNTQTYIDKIKDNILELPFIFADDIQYPQWVLDIPVADDDSLLMYHKQKMSSSFYLYKRDYKLVRNNGQEYLVKCNLERDKEAPKEFNVYFKYENDIQCACFSNKGSAIDCEWHRHYNNNKFGTIRRTKTFKSRIESAVKLIEQWIKEIETETETKE